MSLLESQFGAEIDFVHEPDHVGKLIGAMPSQFHKPRMLCYLRAVGNAFQKVEDDLYALIADRQLGTATGASLGQWGVIAGEQRGSLSDAEYRRFMQARILANRCEGDPETLIRIFQLVTAPSVVETRLTGPSGMQFTAFRQAAMSDVIRARVRRMMAIAQPMTIAFDLIEAIPGWFSFEDRDAADPAGDGEDRGGIGLTSRVI